LSKNIKFLSEYQLNAGKINLHLATVFLANTTALAPKAHVCVFTHTQLQGGREIVVVRSLKEVFI